VIGSPNKDPKATPQQGLRPSPGHQPAQPVAKSKPPRT
jgi:hypothetical protein